MRDWQLDMGYVPPYLSIYRSTYLPTYQTTSLPTCLPTYLHVYFFSGGRGVASYPASGPTIPDSHRYRVSIPLVGPVLNRWIRRRGYLYPYSPVPLIWRPRD